jgi:hypothetical protein
LGSHQEGSVEFSSRGPPLPSCSEPNAPLLMRTQLSPLDETPTLPS